VSVETFRRNEAEYRGRSLGIAGIDERVLVSPLTHEVKATVLGLGACHDEQVALDGPANGAFTSALLRVWDDGRFTGDYRTLRDRIAAEIGSPRQIPSLDLQLIPDHDAGFVDQTPFAPWPRPPRPVQNNPRFMPSVTRSAEQGTEGADLVVDEPDDAEPNGQTSSRTIWSERTAFDEFIMGLGLDHFTSGELLVLGGDHGNPNHRCFGFNSYPPRSLWTNIAATVRALDTLRARLGLPITITSAYRTPKYNGCIENSAKNSLHMQFMALDFKVRDTSPAVAGNALRWLRDKEGLFKGGIGFYRTFVHLDTRGKSVDFAGRDVSVPPALQDHPFV
jgi:hypothetical protein